jgi:hypothetical protein
MLYVVCCMLYVVCCMLYVVCCMLYVVCCMLYVVCWRRSERSCVHVSVAKNDEVEVDQPTAVGTIMCYPYSRDYNECIRNLKLQTLTLEADYGIIG